MYFQREFFKKFPFLKNLNFNKMKKNNFKYYFFKYGLGGLIGIILGIIGITFHQWEFWAVMIPILTFEIIKDDYFNFY